jgi:hypothetical protein
LRRSDEDVLVDRMCGREESNWLLVWVHDADTARLEAEWARP